MSRTRNATRNKPRPQRARINVTCQHCHQTVSLVRRTNREQKYCSRRCASQAYCERTWYSRPRIELDPDEFIGLLRWRVARSTRQRPIEDTDEYQAAWVGLLKACRTYYGNSAPEDHIDRRIRLEIIRDRHGAIYRHRSKGRDFWNGIARRSVVDAGESICRLASHYDADPSRHASLREAVARVTDVIAQMSGELQEIARLRFLDGLEAREIAALSDFPISRVWKLTYKARQILKASAA